MLNTSKLVEVMEHAKMVITQGEKLLTVLHNTDEDETLGSGIIDRSVERMFNIVHRNHD